MKTGSDMTSMLIQVFNHNDGDSSHDPLLGPAFVTLGKDSYCAGRDNGRDELAGIAAMPLQGNECHSRPYLAAIQR